MTAGLPPISSHTAVPASTVFSAKYVSVISDERQHERAEWHRVVPERGNAREAIEQQ